MPEVAQCLKIPQCITIPQCFKIVILQCIMGFVDRKMVCLNGRSSCKKQQKHAENKDEVSYGDSNLGGWSQSFFGRPGENFITRADNL